MMQLFISEDIPKDQTVEEFNKLQFVPLGEVSDIDVETKSPYYNTGDLTITGMFDINSIYNYSQRDILVFKFTDKDTYFYVGYVVEHGIKETYGLLLSTMKVCPLSDIVIMDNSVSTVAPRKQLPKRVRDW